MLNFIDLRGGVVLPPRQAVAQSWGHHYPCYRPLLQGRGARRDTPAFHQDDGLYSSLYSCVPSTSVLSLSPDRQGVEADAWGQEGNSFKVGRCVTSIQAFDILGKETAMFLENKRPRITSTASLHHQPP